MMDESLAYDRDDPKHPGNRHEALATRYDDDKQERIIQAILAKAPPTVAH